MSPLKVYTVPFLSSRSVFGSTLPSGLMVRLRGSCALTGSITIEMERMKHTVTIVISALIYLYKEPILLSYRYFRQGFLTKQTEGRVHQTVRKGRALIVQQQGFVRLNCLRCIDLGLGNHCRVALLWHPSVFL